jgi:hypothetical protein
MDKCADDSYLVVTEANVASYAAKIAHIDNWALVNNLRLNRTKSVEIVFASLSSRRIVEIPLSAVPELPGFARVELINILGVSISSRFSVAQHVDALLAERADIVRSAHSATTWHANQRAPCCFHATTVAEMAYDAST